MDEARTLRPGDGPYPGLLAQIPDRPPELRVRGELGGERRRAAIVGSRAPDEYGVEVARQLAAGLARAGVSVVSGGAMGIDTAAHRGALEAGGHTIAVLGTGVDVPYPAQNRGLLDDILRAGGAIASEQPDGAPALRHHFPARNRIISGLSEVVIVVQAREKSGALITAEWARGQGRSVLAVPGDVRDPLSAGPHRLLRAGARLVTSTADVLAEMGLEERRAQRSLPALSCEGSALLSALGKRPRHSSEIAQAARLPVGETLAGLLALELEGLCEQRPGHYFLRREGI